MNRTPTDQELLARFGQRADQGAFAALVARHQQLVMGLCRRLLGDAHAAEDAFQATFIILAKRALEASRAESVAAWLHGVAWRVATRERDRALHRRREEREAFAKAPRKDGDEAGPVVDEEIERLPSRLRVPLILCYLEGRNQHEVARELGWSPRTLERMLMAAREKLRLRLVRRGVPASGAVLLSVLSAQLAAAAAPSSVTVTTVAAIGMGPAPVEAAGALVKGGMKTMGMAKMTTVAATALIAIGIGTGASVPANFRVPAALAQETRTKGPIPFEQLHDLVRANPAKEGGYLSIPWEPNLSRASRKAAQEGKPLLVFMMLGEPIGVN